MDNMPDNPRLMFHNSLFCMEFMMSGQIIGQSALKIPKVLDQVQGGTRSALQLPAMQD